MAGAVQATLTWPPLREVSVGAATGAGEPTTTSANGKLQLLSPNALPARMRSRQILLLARVRVLVVAVLVSSASTSVQAPPSVWLRVW